MKIVLKRSSFGSSCKVICEGFVLGILEVNKYIRRQKSTVFTGLGTTIFFDSFEDAEQHIAKEIEKHLNILLGGKNE